MANHRKVTRQDNPVSKALRKVTRQDNPVSKALRKVTRQDNPVSKVLRKVTRQDNPVSKDLLTRQVNPFPRAILQANPLRKHRYNRNLL